MGGLLMDEMRALASSSIADLHNCIVSTYAAHPTSTLKEASLQELLAICQNSVYQFLFPKKKGALVEPMCLVEMACNLRVFMRPCVWELSKNANDCAGYPPTLWQPPWNRDFFNVDYAAMLSLWIDRCIFLQPFLYFNFLFFRHKYPCCLAILHHLLQDLYFGRCVAAIVACFLAAMASSINVRFDLYRIRSSPIAAFISSS